MKNPEDYFNDIADQIPDVKKSKMFGALCMKTPNGKASAMFWKECIVVKLQGDVLNDALSLDGSVLFEPMEGRPMNGWVQIPFDYKDQWKMFADIAAQQVKLIEVTKTVKKK
jgi:hypothetical protein